MNALLDRLRLLLEELGDRYEALDAEQQRQARLAGLVAAIVLPLLLVVLPLVSLRIAAERERTAAREQWAAVRELERAILERGLNNISSDAGAGKSADSLLTYLDAAARKVEIQNRVQAMRPIAGRGKDDPGAVEVQLGGLVYEDFLRFLYQVEIEKPVLRIRRAEIQKDPKDPTRLRAVFEVAP